jgi:dTDP-glucose 4,6-dehydratase
VADHARALELVATKGCVGQSYNIGARAERSNLAIVETICLLLDARRPLGKGRSHREQIGFVPDRPGHDRRYAVDATRIGRELGWKPSVSLEQGLARTVDWYLANEWWWRPLRVLRYDGRRLGEPRKDAA